MMVVERGGKPRSSLFPVPTCGIIKSARLGGHRKVRPHGPGARPFLRTAPAEVRREQL